MNDPQTFVARWTALEAELESPFPAKFFRLPVGDYSFLRGDELQLLREVGLPDNAPGFSFEKVEEGMPRVDEVYGPDDDELWSEIGRETVARYRMLGSDGSGNPLVLDIESHEIVLLDHEGAFAPFSLVNSGFAPLLESLLIIQRAEDQAPDVSVAQIQAELAAIDPQVTDKRGYWFSLAADLPDFD